MKKILLAVLVVVLIGSSVWAIELVRKESAATTIFFPIVDADGDIVTSATGLDSEFSEWENTGSDNPSTFADCTNEATEIGATGWYYIHLVAAEVSEAFTAIRIQTTSAGAKTQHILIRTIIGVPANLATTTSGIEVLLEADGMPRVNVEEWDASAVPTPNVSGYPEVDLVYYEGTDDVDGQIQSEAADALTAYDPPTRAEATTDKNAIITEVDANETKIDNILVVVDDSLGAAKNAILVSLDDSLGNTKNKTIGTNTVVVAVIDDSLGSAKNAILVSLDDSLGNTKNKTIGTNTAVIAVLDDSLGSAKNALLAFTTSPDVNVVQISGSSDAADYLEEAFDGDSVTTGARLELEHFYVDADALGGNSHAVVFDGKTYGLFVTGSTAGIFSTGTSYGIQVEGGTYDIYGDIHGSIDSATAVGVGGDGLTQHSISTAGAAELADSCDDRVRASALDVNVVSADANSYDSVDYKPDYWSAVASHSDSGTSGTGLDSATTSRLLHRIVWGQQKGTSGSSDSSLVGTRTVYQAYVAGAATVDTSLLTTWATRNYDTDGDGYLLAELGGAGTRTVTITVKDTSDSTAISGFTVSIYDSSSGEQKGGPLSTNSNGVVVFTLDDETYTVYITKTPWTLLSPRRFVITANMDSTFYASAFDPGNPASADQCKIYVNDVRNLGAGEVAGCRLKVQIPSRYWPVRVGEAPVYAYTLEAVTDASGYVELVVYRSADLTAGDGSSTVKYDLLLEDPTGKRIAQRKNTEIPDAAQWEIEWTE